MDDLEVEMHKKKKKKHSGLQVGIERWMRLQDQTSLNTYLSENNILVAFEIAFCVYVCVCMCFRSLASSQN